MVVSVESIRAISAQFANTVYGFFFEKRVAYPIVANYFRNTWEDVGNVWVWVKLHGVPVNAFSEDGLSVIATKLGTPFMLESFTSDICIQSCGRSSYTRAIIEVWANVELKDTIVVVMPKLFKEGFYTCNVHVEYEWKPLRCVCYKFFGHTQEECPKNPGLGVAKNLKKLSQAPRAVIKGVESAKEVSNSNPFDVLNSVKNDGKLGTNGGTSNLVSNEANSSGSSFWNVETSSTSTAPMYGKVTLVYDDDKPLKKVDYLGDHDSKDDVESVDNDMAHSMASEKVGFGTKSLLEQWRDSYENCDYDEDPYDDDIYDGQDIPDKIQDIYDNLDIRVRGQKKK
ncbi:retrotransposon protein, putative, ty1-copia subclass [Tanacetum coccineum]